jgi:hypothetical protein
MLQKQEPVSFNLFWKKTKKYHQTLLLCYQISLKLNNLVSSFNDNVFFVIYVYKKKNLSYIYELA